MNKQAVEQK